MPDISLKDGLSYLIKELEIIESNNEYSFLEAKFLHQEPIFVSYYIKNLANIVEHVSASGSPIFNLEDGLEFFSALYSLIDVVDTYLHEKQELHKELVQINALQSIPYESKQTTELTYIINNIKSASDEIDYYANNAIEMLMPHAHFVQYEPA